MYHVVFTSLITFNACLMFSLRVQCLQHLGSTLMLVRLDVTLAVGFCWVISQLLIVEVKYVVLSLHLSILCIEEIVRALCIPINVQLL